MKPHGGECYGALPCLSLGVNEKILDILKINSTVIIIQIVYDVNSFVLVRHERLELHVRSVALFYLR